MFHFDIIDIQKRYEQNYFLPLKYLSPLLIISNGRKECFVVLKYSSFKGEDFILLLCCLFSIIVGIIVVYSNHIFVGIAYKVLNMLILLTFHFFLYSLQI